MRIIIIYHGYNNPMYNAHGNVVAHYTWQNMVGLALSSCYLFSAFPICSLFPFPSSYTFFCVNTKYFLLFHFIFFVGLLAETGFLCYNGSFRFYSIHFSVITVYLQMVSSHIFYNILFPFLSFLLLSQILLLYVKAS